jgi:uncharacterized membrane protein
MSNLFVIAFDQENGAERALNALADWQRQKLIKIDDAAKMIRRADGKVKTKHADNLVGKGALGGAFWGALIGTIFLTPIGGAAIGAAVGAVHGRSKAKKQSQAGIDPKFVKEVSQTIQPGGSALFAYTQGAVVEKILPRLKQLNGKLIQSSLTPEDEKMLREAFGVEESQPVGTA